MLKQIYCGVFTVASLILCTTGCQGNRLLSWRAESQENQLAVSQPEWTDGQPEWTDGQTPSQAESPLLHDRFASHQESASVAQAVLTDQDDTNPADGDWRTQLASTSQRAPQPAMPSLVTLPKGSDLQTVINQAGGKALLDFYADWCGPCKRQAVILQQLEDTAAETGTTIVKINIDQHPKIARELSVRSLPTLMMIDNGDVAATNIGLTDADVLTSWMR